MKYIVETEWGGYHRGYSHFLVEAKSEEEAKQLWQEGELLKECEVRSDVEHEIFSVEEYKEDNARSD